MVAYRLRVSMCVAICLCVMSYVQPSSFPKGESGRFDLLEHRSRQVAKRLVTVEAKAAAASKGDGEGGGSSKVEPATGLLKWRDPKTGVLYNDRN
jgi:hypothetical protein